MGQKRPQKIVFLKLVSNFLPSEQPYQYPSGLAAKLV